MVGDEGEAEHAREPGDRLVIVAYDERDVGEGFGHQSDPAAKGCPKNVAP
jgi:hypothetical protein